VLPILMSILILIVAGALFWAAPLFGLSSTWVWVLRIAFLAFGLITAGIILFSYIRERRREAATRGLPGGSELNELLRDAERRIATGQRTGPKSLATLPLLYILGETNSSKTTTVLKSGLDPELIAGQVYRDQDVIPTPIVNLWYTSAAVLVEAGEAVRTGPRLWSKLIRRTRPRAIRSAMGRETPVRAAVVCLSSELFLGPGASETSLAAARSLNQMLRELAVQLGTDVPAYVLLTKLDRVPDFAEFVRNLTNEEASDPFGMPFSRVEYSSGLYAEKAMGHITTVLDQLVFSLGEFRLQLLTRETEQRNIDPVYEFPRELRKLRNNLAGCLVELMRPSHLNFNPYLRGLYFTGVRAQVVEQMVAVAAQAPQSQPADAGATRMFSLEQMRAAAAPPAPQRVAQKIAQWCFLPRLLPSVILQDRSALNATSNSGRTHIVRRVTFALLSVALLGLFACVAVSWNNNRRLEQIIDAARVDIEGVSLQSGSLASEKDLSALDRLRCVLVEIEGYRQHGVPLFYRFGLYQGDRLFEPARAIYFAGFRRLLLTSTKGNLARFLSGLPATSGNGDVYTAAYFPLKAYLIVTAYPKYSTPDFLSPVLMQYWLNGRAPDSDKQDQLARAQFDFYAFELARSDSNGPAAATPDPPVTHARTYLNSFGGEDRIYQQMLTAAGSASRSVDFNRDYQGSAATLIDRQTVPAWFTRAAWAPMQSALAHPERYFSGEAWVLGPQAGVGIDSATITRDLSLKYEQAYIKAWDDFLHGAHVQGYGGLADAALKLKTLSGANSTLLELLYTASHNTNVGDHQIADAFEPAHAVVSPDSSDTFIGDGDRAYMGKLADLFGAVDQAARTPLDPNNSAALQPVQQAAEDADRTALQTSQGFHRTPETQIVSDLLEAPIRDVDNLIRAQRPKAANAGGQSFCSAYSRLLTRFPFAPNGPDASIAEVDAVLNPTSGAIAQLSKVAGPLLNPVPGAQVSMTREFRQFYERLQSLSSLLYPQNPAAGGFSFTVKILPSSGIQTATFEVDKQVVSGINSSKTFIWSPQTSQHAELTVGSISPLSFSGNWALLHLLSRGQREQQPLFPIHLSYPIGFVNGSSNTVVRIEITPPGAAMLLPGGLAPNRCVSTVAH